MKLKALYATLEEVPEALKEYYVEKDGKFLLDAEGVEDVSGLKSALSKEREARKQADAKVKAFIDVVGEDPAKVKAELDRLAELQAIDPNKEADRLADGKAKAKIEQLIQTHQKELAKASDKADGISKQLQKVLIDNAATVAISEAKGSVKLLLPIVHSRTRMRQNEAGNFVAEVLDDSGNPRIADGNGTPMTIKQYVEELRGSDEFGRAFDAEGKGGTGAPAGDKGAQLPPGTKRVSIHDQAALNNNLEGLAKGTVTVTA